MSWSSGAGRVTLTVNGTPYSRWSEFSLTRDVGDIAGRFSVKYFDAARAAAGMPANPSSSPLPPAIGRRESCALALDGETVLTGWIDGMEGQWDGSSIATSISGRDKTGDLADCAASPTGPAEWRNVTLLQVAQQICAPFGIAVRAETAVGAPFTRLALNPHESALSLLEKAARQRAVLVVSDGVGGLVLTTGGRSAAPADIRVGFNVQRAGFRFDDTHRYSDVYVKGQSEKAAGARTEVAPSLSHASAATGSPAIPANAGTIEAAGIQMTGHAVDQEVTRYRPGVVLTRTQSGMSSVTQQAQWRVRVARGLSTTLSYTVLDWRAGTGNALWRPNTVARVFDPWAGIDELMLIRGVTYRMSAQGFMTDISVVGLTAFDRIDEATPKRPLKPVKGNA
nr:hypothetical protein [uncultured Rhodopila sp.]